MDISPEAREAARRENAREACNDAGIKITSHESGYHVQLAINSATENLENRIIQLESKCAELIGQVAFIPELQAQNQQLHDERIHLIAENVTVAELQQQNQQLREALEKIAHKDNGSNWGYIAREALSANPPDFRKEWCKRSVLEMVLNSASPNKQEHPAMFKAWTLARKELEETK